jgi:cytochrome c oxidase subunit 2
VRYAGTPAVTANEIHVPVGTQVRITLESTDVIHSFWVPALAGKVDMIPGHVNHLTIRADDPGTYRGQCAELCGIQHANMAFLVIAQPMGAYRAWLADQSEPARAPSGRLATTGRRTFTTQACAGCHTIRGTSAHGSAGPDLTHLASRRSLAAATLPNDASHLQGWITDPQHAKPGSLMPDVPITPAQANALVAYLRELK